MFLFCLYKVVSVRLPEENGRFRGFGYVEFETRQALIDALALSDEVRNTCTCIPQDSST